MKILELRFKNLNSLFGEWFIDFTHPEYLSHGIFALTGPTGAGKSTILDAICLALYGATPRLGKVTKSDNEIISRQAGDCYAEVLFESQAGRFRCHWAQHRSRKKADGELQTPRHEISEGCDQGKVIEHQLRRVATVVEEKTGMDFERFTRSMLLAQGEFDTFLKADVEQKSKILEQITGTGIYTDISRRVHERYRDERETLNLLMAETSGITILDADQEQEMQQALEEGAKQERILALEVSDTEKKMAWVRGIDGLKREIVSLTEGFETLKGDIALFQPERQRLDRARKAAELDGAYATISSVRKQQQADQSSLNSETAKQPELEVITARKAEALDAAEQFTLTLKSGLKSTMPLIQTVRSLDQALTDKMQALERGDAESKTYQLQIEAQNKMQSQQQHKRELAGKELNLLQEYLENHASDAWLVGGLAGVEEQLANLLLAQQEIVTKSDDEQNAIVALKRSSKQLEACTNQRKISSEQVDALLKTVEENRTVLTSLLGGRLLREYRVEKETLLRELTLLTKIAQLEEHRSRLEDGKACPLCGALDHPFAEGNVPEADAVEKQIETLSGLIRRAEEQESCIKNHEAAEKVHLKNLAESEKLEAAAAHDKRLAEQTITELTQALEKMRADFTQLKSAVLAKLQPLGIDDVPDSAIPALLTDLRNRLGQWNDRVQKKDNIEKEIVDLDGELKRLNAVIETHAGTLAEKQAALNLARQVYESDIAERKELFGEKSPAVEEARLNKGISDAEQREKQARVEHDQEIKKLHAIKTNVEALKNRIELTVSELNALEPQFLNDIQDAGFPDESLFLEARLDVSERDELNAQAKRLDDKHTDLSARQKDREERLSAEINKQLTESPLEELEPVCRELEEKLKKLRDEVAGLKHQLSENSAAKERVKERQVMIDAQQRECHRWETLHALIGSADGKKYRNFAQGLTFELMVSHANRQLEKMSERYLLIRDDAQPLVLNVIDNYQAGEIRSTKNLSGGESFIVSLTLALGLSKMASRKVRVDSLFLDEGFGTLDEDTLETALDTLASLQQDGKLIGVISHVPALKERIGTQIQVSPHSDGKSSISGPGCSKI